MAIRAQVRVVTRCSPAVRTIRACELRGILATTTLASKGLTPETLAKLPCPMHFFLVEPTRIEHLDAEFAKGGAFDALQVVGGGIAAR